MIDLSELPDDVLREAACLAVGMEPLSWRHSFWLANETLDVQAGSPRAAAGRVALELRVGSRAAENWIRSEKPVPWVCPHVESDPAACAALKRAALEAGAGWPAVLRLPQMFGCWMSDPKLAGVQRVPPTSAGILSFYLHPMMADGTVLPAFADSEEMAVTLAVVRWGLETGKVTIEQDGEGWKVAA